MDIRTIRRRGSMMSDINVTPFVDVMLVLLIIFMVAAPMMIQGIDVNLPEVTADPISNEPERFVVSVTAAGKIHVDDCEVELEALGQRLSAMRGENREKQAVLLRVDRKVEYGLLALIMSGIRTAGIEQIGMVTEPLDGCEMHPIPEGAVTTNVGDHK